MTQMDTNVEIVRINCFMGWQFVNIELQTSGWQLETITSVEAGDKGQ